MILGITGALGCGKSAVLALFTARHWQTADADLLCHQIYDEDFNCLTQAIADRWGAKIVQKGKIDRRALGKIVFNDPAELKALTELIYPRLNQKIKALISSWRKEKLNGVIELPLLFEEKYESWFDATLAVWARPEIRHQRLKEKRGFTDDEIRQREQRQMNADQKLERADYALINNSTPEMLANQLDLLLTSLKYN